MVSKMELLRVFVDCGVRGDDGDDDDDEWRLRWKWENVGEITARGVRDSAIETIITH